MATLNDKGNALHERDMGNIPMDSWKFEWGIKINLNLIDEFLSPFYSVCSFYSVLIVLGKPY